MQLTKNFHLDEFMCRDGTPVPEMYLDNVCGLACNLQRLRNLLGPIRVTSGYRTIAHNNHVKGSPRSQHLTASAADIVVLGSTPREVAKLIKKEIRAGRLWQGGVGLYSNFVHYDIRGRKARWQLLTH